MAIQLCRRVAIPLEPESGRVVVDRHKSRHSSPHGVVRPAAATDEATLDDRVRHRCGVGIPIEGKPALGTHKVADVVAFHEEAVWGLSVPGSCSVRRSGRRSMGWFKRPARLVIGADIVPERGDEAVVGHFS